MSVQLSLEAQVAVIHEVVTRMEKRLFGVEGNNGLIGRIQAEALSQDKRLEVVEKGLGDCPVLNDEGDCPKTKPDPPARASNGTFMAGMVIGAGAMFQMVAWAAKALWERLPEWLAAIKN